MTQEHDGLMEMARAAGQAFYYPIAGPFDQCALAVLSWLYGRPVTAEEARKLRPGAVEKARQAIDELLRALEWQVSAEQETETKRAMAYQDLVRLAKERGRDALRALGGDHD